MKIDAYISHFLHIPFPEQLDDTKWAEKWAQVQFLAEKGILGAKKKIMKYQIDLSPRYAAAFGLLASQNLPSKAFVSKNKDNYSLEMFPQLDETFEDMRFVFPNKEIQFSSLGFDQYGANTNVLAPPPIIFCSREKKLIESPINDSDSEVVERWSTNSWQIRMRGLLIDMEHHAYPSGHITELHQLFKYNGVVDVYGTQFIEKGITSMYFKNIEFTPVQGYADTVQFTLSARSISPAGYDLINP